MEYTPYTKLKGDYKLVWGDEFDGAKLNKKLWGQ